MISSEDLIARRSLRLERNGGLAQVVVAIVFGIIAIIAVVLRITSRRMSRVSLGMTDYMIVLALVQTFDVEGVTN